MKNIVIIYGGIGDTIMAYECLINFHVDKIYANKIVANTLIALECKIPIKIFPLTIGPRFIDKFKYLYSLIVLFFNLIREGKCRIAIPSFSTFWKFFPFLNISILEKKHKRISRNKAINFLFQKCF